MTAVETHSGFLTVLLLELNCLHLGPSFLDSGSVVENDGAEETHTKYTAGCPNNTDANSYL